MTTQVKPALLPTPKEQSFMSTEKILGTQLRLRSRVGLLPKDITHDGKPLNFHRPCLNWQGAIDNTGYGVIRAPKGFMGSKSGVIRTHRLALFIKQKFPVKAQVDHLCRNRLCIEPTHLVMIGPKTHGKLSKKDQTNG